MTQPLGAALVDVPCAVVLSSASGLTVSASGRRLTIPLSEIHGSDRDTITIAAHLAARLGLTTTTQCLRPQDIARRFGRPVDWIYKRIDRLMAEEGFPRPVTSIGQRLWDPASVDAWFGRHNPQAADQAAAGEAVEAAERSRLAAAYGSGVRT